ncbi:MAG: ATP-binding cassette domain-containing protein [Nitrospirota bacterium]
MAAIEVTELTKRFNNLTAVDHISFTVESGEVFGFLGPNGAGKTTTINILCTLLLPTSGRALVNNHDCIKEPAKVRSAIGLVFQDTTLDTGLTAYENLRFHGYLYNMDKKTIGKRVDEMLRLVELTDRKDDIVKKFSGGMKRRLEIARGLLHYPKVLFLDEPTLGLDPQTRNLIWEFVFELRKKENVTIFMTTHYMEEAEGCDRIAIIDHGKIIALGSPAGLKKMLRGDIVRLKTYDNKLALEEIQERFGYQTTEEDGTIRIVVDEGDRFIPILIKEMTQKIISVSLQEPTLNDVFLHLTGRTIRIEETSDSDAMKDWVRQYRRH